MRRRTFLALAVSGVAGAAMAAETARDIVAAADQVRNPGQPFRSRTTLTQYVNGKPASQNVLVVYSKEDPASGQFRNLIRYVAPPRDAGKMVLLDEQALWFYDPASKASVRISPQQRLVGQASIADVLSVNLASDYRAVLVREEAIKDAAGASRLCHRLELSETSPLAAYRRVEYWVEKGTNHPLKARYYADSGRLLKTLYYKSFASSAGRVRPTQAVIIDGVNPALVTTVDFGDLRLQAVPESWFQREYLPRLQAEP
jgi:outer membrane lipoprotein-sorting protein